MKTLFRIGRSLFSDKKPKIEFKPTYHSVYPEGYKEKPTPEEFNRIWKHIHTESNNAYELAKRTLSH